jgi:hypothetical protein
MVSLVMAGLYLKTFLNLTRILNMEEEMTQERIVPWYIWPFWALWRLVSWIVVFAGRLVAVILGSVLMIAGILLSLTIIGALLGIPLFIVGILLVFRGLF